MSVAIASVPPPSDDVPENSVTTPLSYEETLEQLRQECESAQHRLPTFAEAEAQREEQFKELEATLEPLAEDEAALVDEGRHETRTPEAENEEDCRVLYADAKFPSAKTPLTDLNRILFATKYDDRMNGSDEEDEDEDEDDEVENAPTASTAPRAPVVEDRLVVFTTPTQKMVRINNAILAYTDFIYARGFRKHETTIECILDEHRSVSIEAGSVSIDDIMQLLEAEPATNEPDGGTQLCLIMGLVMTLLSVLLSVAAIVTSSNGGPRRYSAV
jgi:hypothetical protein